MATKLTAQLQNVSIIAESSVRHHWSSEWPSTWVSLLFPHNHSQVMLCLPEYHRKDAVLVSVPHFREYSLMPKESLFLTTINVLCMAEWRYYKAHNPGLDRKDLINWEAVYAVAAKSPHFSHREVYVCIPALPWYRIISLFNQHSCVGCIHMCPPLREVSLLTAETLTFWCLLQHIS